MWYPLTIKDNFTCLIPRPYASLSRLVSHMNDILKASEGHDLRYAQATLCVARLFVTFDLFENIPTGFFRAHLNDLRNHNSLLEASGTLRLRMLAFQCFQTQDLRLRTASGGTCGLCIRLNVGVEAYLRLFCAEGPDFIIKVVGPLLNRQNDDLLPKFPWNLEAPFLEMYEGKVRVLFVWQYPLVPYTWLSRTGGPWILTQKAAKLKECDKDGNGGVIEWNVENDHYELKVSVRAANADFNRYLRTFDPAGFKRINQARTDVCYEKQEKKERGRSKTVAAMSMAEIASRNAHEGRFWCLA